MFLIFFCEVDQVKDLFVNVYTFSYYCYIQLSFEL